MNMATTIIVLTRKSNTMIRPSLSRLYHRYVSSSSSEISPAVSSSCTHMHSSLSTSRLIDYARGWAWQQTLLSRRLEVRRNHRNNEDKDNCVNDSDIVLILEHKPVYTLGRGADENNLTFLQHDKSEEHSEYHRTIRAKLSRSCRGADSARLSIDRGIDKEMLQRAVDERVDILAESVTPVIAPNDVPVYRVDRGGDVTWHGPGQLVVYPLLDLKRFPYRQDLHWYLRSVEDVILLTLQHYDIQGERDEINTGVWVGDKKIAAVGVSSSRWITTHGFALNVCPDLAYFDTSMILPCGIKGRGVTSIAEVLMQRKKDSHNVYVPTMEEVQTVVCQSLQEVFDMSLIMDCEENIVLS